MDRKANSVNERSTSYSELLALIVIGLIGMFLTTLGSASDDTLIYLVGWGLMIVAILALFIETLELLFQVVDRIIGSK